MGDPLKTDKHELVAGGGGGLTSFFVPGEIDKAFRENEWAVAEMVQVLTNIVRCTDVKTITKKDGTLIEEPVTTARERMAAITMLDRKAKEAMVLGGLIQTDRLTLKKTAEDGTEAEYTVEGKRIAGESSSRLKSTLELLTAASHSQSPNEIIDVVEDELNESRDGSGDDPSGGDGRVPSGRSDSGLRGTESGGVGGDGSGPCPELHGGEHEGTNATLPDKGGKGSVEAPASGGEENDDQGTVGGADDEREAGLSEQPGRSDEGQEDGGRPRRHEGNPPTDRGLIGGVPERRPIIPGEHAAKRKQWWDAGIPRRSPDTDPGSIRDCETAESQFDRLKRIASAQKQAAAATASYVEQRDNSKRTSTNLKPGDEPGTSD